MKLVGHRGLKSLAPENTIPSFQLAIDYALDGIEVDVWMSRDGELVLIHDETVDRTCEGSGKVTEMTAAELKRLDAGSKFSPEFRNTKIPFLTEFLDLVKDNEMLLNIEIKDYRREVLNKVFALIDGLGLNKRVVITSFSPDVTMRASKDYGLKVQVFPPSAYGKSFNEAVYEQAFAVGIPMRELTKDLVDDFKSRSIEPWCWCPDTEEAVELALEAGAVLATVNDPRPALKRRK